MSGGVDSSVAAYLMKKEGFRCMGVNMRLYHNRDIGQKLIGSCCSLQDADDAAEVCYRLNLPFRMLDYTAQFKKEVMDKFVKTYETGGTPNPCIDCNRYMKFKHLADFADEIGFDKIVTGHYARVDYDQASGRYLLKKAVDEKKDQSYVLYMLT
ncbi:MAG: 7-cyano-7-deazaguanine synthase, partial [Lachnospiraceae bacterium]|nr:7-cyano-7-deazaguanine synthase [Lachnospiraceae bacterium]